MISTQRPRLLLLLLIGVGVCLQQIAQAQEIPDFTQGDTIPSDTTHDWNLGPTGARGWIHSHRLETSEARQIYITEVEAGSPSDGKLFEGDVILGIDDVMFSYDPRTEMGKGIQQAESEKGRLRLNCWRNGEEKNVVLKLRTMGGYSPTAPFDCRKSEKIFEEGCAALAQRMRDKPNAGNGITRAYNVLALLASGRKEYLPIIREQVSWAAQYSDPESKTLHCWFYGPVNLLLAEYTLATDDKTYLPDLERITMEIVRGQSAVGTWGHRFSRPDGRLNGYGMMNAPGLPMTLSLVLARKAGVDHPELDLAIERSVRLMRFYVGKGCIPYGDHAPWIETHDDNGKNGIAAVLFNVLEDAEAAAYFSRMSVASHGAERELGHTGNFFNMLWAMPGVAISGPEATGAWVEEFGWYYDLARRWDGNFRHQGPPEPKPDSYNRWDASGAYLLAYAQPLKSLYVTGKTDDVLDSISRESAESLIDDGRDYSHRLREKAYAHRNVESLFDGLSSWSPVVRERSAISLAERSGEQVPRLIDMLGDEDLYSRIGACQGLAKLKGQAAPAISELEKTLDAEDLWLRIKAAEALASIGEPARTVAPKLLTMLASENLEKDPRNMEQRFLCFALFDQRTGLLRGNLEGIDREALYRAVRAGLRNEDGRARGALSSVYKNLDFEEVEALLPAIHRAVVEPSPSGIMFADDIRLKGLEVLAKHKVKEGMELCIEVVEFDRWGQGRRLERCLKILQQYGGAAREMLPRLKRLEEQMLAQKHPKATAKQLEVVKSTISVIETDSNPPELRSLPQQ